MKRKISLPVLLTWMFLMNPPLFGQMLPFFTNTAQTVGFESNAVRTFSRFLARNELRSGGEEVQDPLNREVFVFAQVLAVPVRIDSETVLIGIVPVLHKELELNPPGGGPRVLSDTGFGDATLLLKRRFYVNNFQGGGLQATFIGGVKIPTGDDDERDEHGDLLPPDLQLGTGSVDFPVGVIFTAWRDRLGFNSEVIHQFNTESDGFDFGDETRINMAVGYRLFPREFRSIRDRSLSAYLEINNSISRRASVNGDKVTDSGGTQVFLTPGLQLVLTPRFLVEAAFQIPVLQELNGTQLDFSPNANLGIRLQF